MNEASATIIVAIIGFFGSIIVGVISSFTTAYTVNKQHKKDQEEIIDNLDKSIAIISVKVDTLWDIYAKDAIREAKKSGLVRENSPLYVTDAGRDLLSSEFLSLIEKEIDEMRATNIRKNICVNLINTHMDRLILISIEKDVSLQMLIGIIRSLCEQEK